jgi:hypothetical protein
MGGPGSGRRPGSSRFPGMHRGRIAGVPNSPEHTEAMRAGMLAALEIKANRPDNCDECGRVDSLERFRSRWLCGSCLSGPMVPLRIENFALSGTSNLGSACEHRRREIG